MAQIFYRILHALASQPIALLLFCFITSTSDLQPSTAIANQLPDQLCSFYYTK